MNEHLQNMERLLKRTGFKDWLAVLILVGNYVFLFMLLRRAMPNENRDVLMIAVGSMFGTVATVVSFYFGSSKDKSDADKAYNIRKVAEATTTPAVALLQAMTIDQLQAKYKELFQTDCPADLNKEQLIEILKKLV